MCTKHMTNFLDPPRKAKKSLFFSHVGYRGWDELLTGNCLFGAFAAPHDSNGNTGGPETPGGGPNASMLKKAAGRTQMKPNTAPNISKLTGVSSPVRVTTI